MKMHAWCRIIAKVRQVVESACPALCSKSNRAKHAEANATAIATALVEGFLSVETCNGCTAAVEILASATETAFVEAIAESSAQVRPVLDTDVPVLRMLGSNSMLLCLQCMSVYGLPQRMAVCLRPFLCDQSTVMLILDWGAVSRNQRQFVQHKYAAK